jgi:hypothetical protein
MFLNDFNHSRGSALGTGLLVVSLLMVGSSAHAAWTPPLGIPAPSFGITNVARAVPNPWTVATAGFYYVEATKAGATDTSNPYGTPAKPRLTIPTDLPAGSVVELHGTYDQAHNTPNEIQGRGTSANPVFVRGVSATSRPLVRNTWQVSGTYMILENLEFGPLNTTQTGSIAVMGQEWDTAPTHHLAIRHSEVHGNANGGGVGIESWFRESNNIVLYHNFIHDNGDVNATFDQDVHCIHVGDHVNNIWILENEMARCSGDGIQINASTDLDATTHHIYVGRNVSHHHKQSGFWAKQATDVVFSQNEAYGMRPSDSGMGQCFGNQYGTDYIWFIFNHAHDCEYGIGAMSDDGGLSHNFIIGNVIHNIHRTTSGSGPGDAWGPSAIMMVGGLERHVINNTIYDVDSGVNSPAPNGSLEIAGNIIANVTQPAAGHVMLGFNSLASTAAVHHNVLFGDPRMSWGSERLYLTAAQMTSMLSLSSDPRFVNAPAVDFHLQASSPAVGAAGAVNSVYATFQQRYGLSIATDIEGSPRPATAYAIGAYEKVCATTPVIPGTPVGFTASATSTAISVQWTGLAAVGCTAAPSYILEIGTATGLSNLANAAVGTVTTISIPVTGVPAGSYYLRVRATNVAGTSGASNEVPVVFGAVVPGVPGTLSFTMAATTMKLTWAVPATGSVTGYVVEIGSAVGLKNLGTVNVSAAGTTLSGNKPVRGTYYFRVKAKNTVGVGSPTNDVKVVVP